jgi:ribulose-5-phosphate 4-epimerase/fuculose-1-phosphate aldolase
MGQFDSAKALIVETAQELTRKGYLMATGGNLSVRIAGQSALAITPSNYDYMKMLPEDICVLDFELKVLEGNLKPSVESGMHAAIYRVRPDVNAVVHTHQVYASTLTLIRTPIPALFDEQTRFLGRSVNIIPYAPSGPGCWRHHRQARPRPQQCLYDAKPRRAGLWSRYGTCRPQCGNPGEMFPGLSSGTLYRSQGQ